jgi:hypothetical protein
MDCADDGTGYVKHLAMETRWRVGDQVISVARYRYDEIHKGELLIGTEQVELSITDLAFDIPKTTASDIGDADLRVLIAMLQQQSRYLERGPSPINLPSEAWGLPA